VLFGPAFPRNAVLRVFGEFGQFVGLADLDENCVDALDTTFVRNFREQPEHALVFPSPRGQVLNDDNFRHRPELVRHLARFAVRRDERDLAQCLAAGEHLVEVGEVELIGAAGGAHRPARRPEPRGCCPTLFPRAAETADG
jgi:hypothetical protein